MPECTAKIGLLIDKEKITLDEYTEKHKGETVEKMIEDLEEADLGIIFDCEGRQEFVGISLKMDDKLYDIENRVQYLEAKQYEARGMI